MPGSRSTVAAFVFAVSCVAIGAVVPSIAREAQPAAERIVDHATPAQQLVLHSLSLIGVRYRFGGDSPDTGLDCSGLVRHVFDEVLGFELPRRSEEMSRQGTPVPKDRLQPGDLVFFNTLRRAFSHVGIYIGENRFVHAPSSGGRVRIESIASRYWAQRFNGARRVVPEAGAPGALLYASGRETAPPASTLAEPAFVSTGAEPPFASTSAGATAAPLAPAVPPYAGPGGLLGTIYAY